MRRRDKGGKREIMSRNCFFVFLAERRRRMKIEEEGERTYI